MRRAALLFLALASPTMLIVCFTGGEVGEWLFVSIGLLFPSALIILGSGERDRAVRSIALALGAVLGGGGALTLLLSRSSLRHAWAGLPLAGWVVLLLLGIVPLILTSVGYAIFFRGKRDGPDERGGKRGAGR